MCSAVLGRGSWKVRRLEIHVGLGEYSVAGGTGRHCEGCQCVELEVKCRERTSRWVEALHGTTCVG